MGFLDKGETRPGQLGDTGILVLGHCKPLLKVSLTLIDLDILGIQDSRVGTLCKPLLKVSLTLVDPESLECWNSGRPQAVIESKLNPSRREQLGDTEILVLGYCKPLRKGSLTLAGLDRLGTQALLNVS